MPILTGSLENFSHPEIDTESSNDLLFIYLDMYPDEDIINADISTAMLIFCLGDIPSNLLYSMPLHDRSYQKHEFPINTEFLAHHRLRFPTHQFYLSGPWQTPSIKSDFSWLRINQSLINYHSTFLFINTEIANLENNPAKMKQLPLPDIQRTSVPLRLRIGVAVGAITILLCLLGGFVDLILGVGPNLLFWLTIGTASTGVFLSSVIRFRKLLCG